MWRCHLSTCQAKARYFDSSVNRLSQFPLDLVKQAYYMAMTA